MTDRILIDLDDMHRIKEYVHGGHVKAFDIYAEKKADYFQHGYVTKEGFRFINCNCIQSIRTEKVWLRYEEADIFAIIFDLIREERPYDFVFPLGVTENHCEYARMYLIDAIIESK